VSADERRLSRGDLLRIAGAGAGAAATGSLLAGDAWGRTAALKVGVLTPTGSSYPRMGESLLAGLELGLPEASLLVRQVERGYGGALAGARELLDSGAQVVVAGISAPVAHQLAPLFRERRRPLVVANVGAHVVRPEERRPYVLHNSLLDWQASFSIGCWAARRGERALVLTSQSDAGYDSLYAFRRGFGGETRTIVTQPGGESLLAQLRALPRPHPTVVYILASGRHAASILRAYRASGLRARVIASAFAVDDHLLPSLGASARGLTSCASWPTALADAEFAAAFRHKSGRRPDAFAVLGYDTALLLAAGSRRRGSLIEALRRAPVEGIRGTLRVDKRTNTIVGPLFLREVRGARNVVVGRAPAVGAFPRALAPIADETTSGYINEYLCA
jgi:branched-chain amino acid transport system substrate-binding protein